MTHVDQKLSFSLHEVCKENKPSVTYDELLKLADNMEMQTMIAMDDYIALEMEYGDNYTKKDLDKIAEYYEISKRKKKKQDPTCIQITLLLKSQNDPTVDTDIV